MSTALTPAAPTAPPPKRSPFRGPGGTREMAVLLDRMVTDGSHATQRHRNRWQENRAMFRGDQWLMQNVQTGALRVQASDQHLRSGRRRDTINRIQPYVEGRISQYATERPPFRVIPAGNDARAVEGAHQAEKLIEAMWGEDGWNVKSRIPEMARAGETDGIAFLYVNWDPHAGRRTAQPLAVTPEGPVTDPAALGALQEMDPEGQSLWKWVYPKRPLGEVVWRVVRPGALAVDPFAVSDFTTARWIIESRVVSRHEAERIAGRSLTDLIGESDRTLGRMSASSGGDVPEVNVDDGESGTDRRRRDAVILRELYHVPHGDFPNGAHIVWLDKAPATPIVEAEWEDDLPYRAFVPRPDGGGMFNARGTVDQLKPIQRRFNRYLSLLHEHLDRVARPPLLLPEGSLKGDSLYNEKGYAEYRPAFGVPTYFQAPSEPVSTLTTHLQWMDSQMAEVANLPPVARGQSPGGGVEAATALQLQLQQAEQALSSTTAELVGVYEWAVARALKLVARFYILPRAINAPGVSDSLQFRAFTGEMLAGAHRFRITGSLQPATKAAEMQGLMQFAPILGESIRPYVSRLIGGDTTDFKRADESQRKRQERKNLLIAALPTQPKAEAVYENFEQDKVKFASAMQAAAEEAQMMAQAMPAEAMIGPDGAPMPPPAPPSPMDLLGQRGVAPPSLIDSLQQAGITVPVVEDQDDPVQQMQVLNLWRVSEEFERMPPLVHQVAREYGDRLLQKLTSQLSAMGAQDPSAPGPEGPPQGGPGGSPPAPKGTPSPPRETGQPAGMPPPRLPTGG